MILAVFLVGIWCGAVGGLALGVALCAPWNARRRGDERPRHSRAGVTMKGGQALMGPNQPRPQVQARIPAPPPREGVSSGRRFR